MAPRLIAINEGENVRKNVPEHVLQARTFLEWRPPLEARGR